MKYSEIVYIINDEVKLNSDDEFFTESHILFLIDKYRAALLKKLYADIKKEIPESNYQTICLELEEVNAIDGEPCTGGTYLRSKEALPTLLPIGNSRVYPVDYFQGNITYISRDRFRYVGHNKYLKNIIYTALGPDYHLYFKSNNPQHKLLERVKFTGIFEDAKKASDINEEDDIFDRDVAIEDALVPSIIEMVVKELLGYKYHPLDTVNNASPATQSQLPTSNNKKSKKSEEDDTEE